VKAGDPSTLRWHVVNATSVELQPLGTVAEIGEQTIRPTRDSVFTLRARNGYGTKGVQLGVIVSSSHVRRRPIASANPADIVVQARDCSLIRNAVIRGAGWLQTETGADETVARCGATFAHSSSVELFVTYASEDTRPVRVTINNYIIQEKALAATTGGWDEPNSVEQSLGVVRVTSGKNILEFYSEHQFPHIQQIRFHPVKQ
jgi:hypothetical protein